MEDLICFLEGNCQFDNKNSLLQPNHANYALGTEGI